MSTSFINLNDFSTYCCSICFDEILFQNTCSIILPCGHVFHYDCFSKIRNSHCPLCRRILDIPCTPILPNLQNSRSERRNSHLEISTDIISNSDHIIYLISEFH